MGEGGGGECGSLIRKKGLWSEKEDKILREYISEYGEGKWSRISKLTGLKRNGKSCRLRWLNYLSPTVKKDDFSHQEEDLIIRLHKLLGNRWSLIAGRIPGRTDNQVKNHWNTHLSKKLGPKRKGCKKQKISCIPLSSSSSELECTKEMANSPGLNRCPSNPSSNFPFFENNGELIDRPITMEEDGSSWSPMFGTNTTVQELDQIMMSDQYSNLNYNTLNSVDQVYPLEVLWDGLWPIDQEWSHI